MSSFMCRTKLGIQASHFCFNRLVPSALLRSVGARAQQLSGGALPSDGRRRPLPRPRRGRVQVVLWGSLRGRHPADQLASRQLHHPSQLLPCPTASGMTPPMWSIWTYPYGMVSLLLTVYISLLIAFCHHSSWFFAFLRAR